MKKVPYLTLRIFLWITCVYNLIVGMAGIFFPQMAPQVAVALYGIDLTLTPQVRLIIVHVGTLCLVLGILMAFAAIDPVKNKSVIYGGIVYFGLRIFDRIIFWNLIEEQKADIYPAWLSVSALGIVILLIMLLGLLIFRPKNES